MRVAGAVDCASGGAATRLHCRVVRARLNINVQRHHLLPLTRRQNVLPGECVKYLDSFPFGHTDIYIRLLGVAVYMRELQDRQW